MNTVARPIRHMMEYCTLVGLSAGMRLLSVERAQAAGRRMGRLWYGLDARRRRVALDNITMAFDGQKSKSEVESLSREVFEQVGVTAS